MNDESPLYCIIITLHSMHMHQSPHFDPTGTHKIPCTDPIEDLARRSALVKRTSVMDGRND
eukprot:m.1352454 g.1352454  ORF g.1352454 m.1352454 type:complete len:61 (+) comp24924_c0_seq14:672-854(+)